MLKDEIHYYKMASKKCLNVRQKLGTWKFFNVFLSFPMFFNVFQCYLLSFSLSLSHYLTHSLTISLYLTLTLFQSLIESLLTCWTTFVFISMLKSHSLTLALSLSHTLSLSHSFNVSFNHSRHAEQVLFSCLGSKVAVYRRKLQWFFSWEPALWLLDSQVRVLVLSKKNHWRLHP